MTPQAGYAVAAIGVVAILLVNFNRLPLWTYHLTLTAGTVLISFVIASSGDPTSAYTMFYVWIALYAFYFFSWAEAFFQVACVAAAYGAVLRFSDAVSVATARSLITVGTVLSAGILIAMLKNRVDTLVERLSDSARTDPLTGLLNRRGFDQAFSQEDFPAGAAARMAGPLTVSLGVASFPFDGTTPSELLAGADQALYEAKRGGRDRTVVRTVLAPA